MTMTKIAMVGTTALFASFALAVSSPALAFGIQVVTEDPVSGYVGAIPTSSPAIIVASDGEASFDPFGAGYDTTDGIQLNGDWAPDPAYASAFAPGYWTQLPGTSTWVLPACINGVCENGNVYEPIAKWYFVPGGGWNPGTLSILMMEPDGSWSDLVKIANDGPGGAATITFISDGAPEPAAWALMLLGFGAMGGALRMARRSKAALA